MVFLFTTIVDGHAVTGAVKCSNNVLLFWLKSFFLYWKGKFAKTLDYYYIIIFKLAVILNTLTVPHR